MMHDFGYHGLGVCLQVHVEISLWMALSSFFKIKFSTLQSDGNSKSKLQINGTRWIIDGAADKVSFIKYHINPPSEKEIILHRVSCKVPSTKYRYVPFELLELPLMILKLPVLL